MLVPPCPVPELATGAVGGVSLASRRRSVTCLTPRPSWEPSRAPQILPGPAPMQFAVVARTDEWILAQSRDRSTPGAVGPRGGATVETARSEHPQMRADAEVPAAAARGDRVLA